MKRFLLGCLVWAFIGLLCVIVLVFSLTLIGMTHDLSEAHSRITALEAESSAVVSELSAAKLELALVTKELSLLKLENEKLRSGDKYRLRDHTYKEVMDFLATDLTNTKKYIKGEYEVRHFARDVNNSAKEKGFRCALVYVGFPERKYYMLVAFQTVDMGLVFINPRDDRVMKVTKGSRLWRDNGYTVTWDDTIVQLLFYW